MAVTTEPERHQLNSLFDGPIQCRVVSLIPRDSELSDCGMDCGILDLDTPEGRRISITDPYLEAGDCKAGDIITLRVLRGPLRPRIEPDKDKATTDTTPQYVEGPRPTLVVEKAFDMAKATNSIVVVYGSSGRDLEGLIPGAINVRCGESIRHFDLLRQIGDQLGLAVSGDIVATGRKLAAALEADGRQIVIWQADRLMAVTFSYLAWIWESSPFPMLIIGTAYLYERLNATKSESLSEFVKRIGMQCCTERLRMARSHDQAFLESLADI